MTSYEVRISDWSSDVAPSGEWMVCVRETHPIGSRGSVDVVNEIVRLPTSEPSEPELLVSGPDFLACPRVSPDGEQLCWIDRSEEHTSELQSLMRISYAVFCLKKKKR